jgi:uncharacterized membrane protein YkoI
MDSVLTGIYYDPLTGFTSANKLLQKARDLGHKYSLKQVKQFLSQQQSHQLTKQVTRPKLYNTIIATAPRSNYQMDIIIYDRYEWNHYKYILCIIDVYSRYVQAAALTNRRMETVIGATEKIFKVMGVPASINCDNEFNTHAFSSLMGKNKITMWYSQPDEINKNAIVERFNRTLALLLQRWRVGTSSHNWPKILPSIIQNYNSTYHNTIHGKPVDVFSGQIKNTQTIIHLRPSFSVGDNVRIKLKKKVFGKGDELTHSDSVYTVTALKKNKAELKNIVTGEVLKTLYKFYELSRVGSIVTHQVPLLNDGAEHRAIQSKKSLAKKNQLAGVTTADIVDTKRAPKPYEREYEVEKILGEGIDEETGRKIYEVKWVGYNNTTWESYQSIRATAAYGEWLKSRKKNI